MCRPGEGRLHEQRQCPPDGGVLRRVIGVPVPGFHALAGQPGVSTGIIDLFGPQRIDKSKRYRESLKSNGRSAGARIQAVRGHGSEPPKPTRKTYQATETAERRDAQPYPRVILA